MNSKSELKLIEIDDRPPTQRKIDEELPLTSEPNQEQECYSRVFFDRVLSKWQYRGILLAIFVVIGMTQGYLANLILELQENGATYADQSYLALAGLPYTLKMFLAPLIDLFFISKFGKCKTWIALSSLLISITLVLYSMIPSLSSASPHNITTLFFCWVFINTLVVLLQISAEVWIIKIFQSQNEKGSQAAIVSIGQGLGTFIGLNLFVPLSDKEWLNSVIFTGNPLTRPIITDQEFIIVMSILSLSCGIFVTLFVAEKIDDGHNQESVHNFKQFLAVLPKFFALKSIRTFLIWAACIRSLFYMVEESLILKLIDNGIKRTFIVNVATVTFPVLFIGTIVAMKVVQRNNFLKIYHLAHGYAAIVLLLTFFVYADLHANGNLARSKALVFVFGLLMRFQVTSYMFLGYLNTVAPPALASTFITFFLSFNNFTSILPGAIGLRIISSSYVNYDYFAVGLLGTQLLAIFFLYPWAIRMDRLGPNE